MKPTIIALVVVIVMGVLAVNRDALFQALEDASTYETAVVKEEVIKEVHPEWATDEEALQAAKDVIRRKELEAELESLEANFAATTATYEAERAEYVERKTQLEKDLGSY